MLRLLRLPEISELTGIPISTLRYLRHIGSGPPTFLLAGRVVARESDVVAWIDDQSEEPR